VFEPLLHHQNHSPDGLDQIFLPIVVFVIFFSSVQLCDETFLFA
jgi:hypothetical protein